MPMEPDVRLIQLEERVLELRRIERMVERVRGELSAERKRLRGLRERLALEEADVAALEAPGLRRLFASLLRDRDAELERERTEAHEARVELDHCAAAVEGLVAERAALRERLAALGDAPARLEAARADKEREVLDRGGEVAQRLARLRTRAAAVGRQRIEVGEAIDDGNQVWVLIGRALRLREQAANTHGRNAAAVRAELCSQAHLCDREARRCVRRFRRELDDLDPSVWPAAVAEAVRGEFDVFETSGERGKQALQRLTSSLDDVQRALVAEAARLEIEYRDLLRRS